MVAPRHHRFTLAEYVELEDHSNVKHEFLNGEIFALSGGTLEHARLAGALITLVGGQLRGGPRYIYSSDVRISIQASGLYTYPDAAVICGDPERAPESPTHATNPRVLFEVLGPGTEDYDRGEKREHYQKLPSLQSYVLIAQDRQEVEVYTRMGEAWTHRAYGRGEIIELSSIAARLDVNELYDAAGLGG